MLHYRFFYFFGFIFAESTRYFGEKKIVDKKKSAVDEDGVEMDGVDDCVDDRKSFF